MTASLMVCVWVVFLVSSSFAAQSSRNDYVETLTSKEMSQDWGSWSSWVFCNNDHFAEGFQLKIEGSDVGATGFILMCDDNDVLDAGNENQYGDWQTVFCSTGYTIRGFQSKVEDYQGWDGNDAAMSAVNAYCTNGISANWIVLHGNGPGSWGSADYCDSQSRVCGYQQKVEQCGLTTVDCTGLQAVRLACCTIPTPSPTRAPTRFPTPAPTESPTDMPTDSPSRDPTRDPTSDPTAQPTTPTYEPTVVPTNEPTFEPSLPPTTLPTLEPTPATNAPSVQPTNAPSSAPTSVPLRSGNVDIPTQEPTQEVNGNAGERDSVATDEGGFVENNTMMLAAVFAGMFLCTLLLFVVYCVHQRRKQKEVRDGAARVISMSNLSPSAAIAIAAVSPSAEGDAMTTTGVKKLSNVLAEAELPDEVDGDSEEADQNALYNEMVAPTQGRSRSSSEEREIADHDGMYTVPQKMNTNNGMKSSNASDPIVPMYSHRVCDECGQSVAAAMGKQDEDDGNWYCNACWSSFYETKQ